MLHIFRVIRRLYYVNFKKNYVREQLKKRKGTCGNHGCCGIAPTTKIIFWSLNCYDKKNKLCKIYEKRPKICKIYPFDEKDKHPKTLSYCNFYWEE